ncbi:hypothetical protein TSUD_311040 [Trifolium subterraneum]|uniref:peptidylprolyl isomerase n=1 Tax=Trifolium subterraneum TaxID=3900 RepID=A0A2Z6MK03_TRISU|nr:hypothetical protein TSUD_311040 [Trifolium subterraneum]
MTSLCSSCSANSVTCLSNKWNGGGSNPSLRRRQFTVVALSQSRRSAAIFISSLPFTFLFLSPPPPAEARERRKKKNIPIDDYLTSPVSSRESKILAGNRTIAQPYVFKVGAPPGKERKREFVDNPNGLFSAQAAPKPPSAMYTIVEGMRVGGKRTVIVPPEKGYGPKGKNEIPPGATFELNIELLQVAST